MSGFLLNKDLINSEIFDKILHLYLSLGRTNLFRIVKTSSLNLDIYQFYLKETSIVLIYHINDNELKLTIAEDDKDINLEEFWSKIPQDYKKILVYHLGEFLI